MATQNKWSKKGLSLACVVANRPVTTRQYATINLGADPGYTGLPTGVPKGGAVHQALRKTAAGNYAMDWMDDPAHAALHAPGGTDALPWTEIHGRGPTAQRPAAAPGNAGYTYYDTDLKKNQRSSGAAWEDCGGEKGDKGADGSGTSLPNGCAEWLGILPYVLAPHTMNLMDDGRLIAMSGTRIVMYDPVVKTWTQGATHPGSGSMNMTRLDDGRFLIVGGPGGDYVTRTCYLVAADGLSMVATGSLSLARNLGALGRLAGGKIGFFGSWNSNITACEVYNPATGQWSTVASLPASAMLDIRGCGLTDGRMVYGSGYHTPKALYTYDPVANTHTGRGDLLPETGTAASSGIFCTLPGNKAICIPQNSNRLYVFDGATNTVKRIGTIPGPSGSSSTGGWMCPASLTDTSLFYLHCDGLLNRIKIAL